tara:strand:- start:168 stop:752 length:585 start_codon:yes stop_codon:yes gene_type:complete
MGKFVMKGAKAFSKLLGDTINNTVQTIQNVVPLNVRAFATDIASNVTGIDAINNDISEKHLNPRERLALQEATKVAQSQGRNYIEYEDYMTEGGAYGDVGGGDESAWAPLTQLLNPGYSMKTTFGQMNFSNNPDGTTTYTDRYNFNDANTADAEAETFLEGAEEGGLSLYGQARNVATHLGSGPGEGANVNITL